MNTLLMPLSDSERSTCLTERPSASPISAAVGSLQSHGHV